MGALRKVEPKLYTIDYDVDPVSKTRSKAQRRLMLHKVSELPDERPFGLFDLDGTLTKPGQELLMAVFVRQNPDLGHPVVQKALIDAFEDWKKGKKVYEDYLEEIGSLYAEMLARANLTRSQVMKVSQKWFEKQGRKEVLKHAVPMMDTLDHYGFDRIMVTGAPGEIAYPFAAHMGIEHVFAMLAEVDANGRYTGTMRYEHNTGLLSNKGQVCRELKMIRKTGFAAGDTASDSVLMRTAIECHKSNPDDIIGRAFLMNPRADVLKTMKSCFGDYFDDGQITEIPRSMTHRRFMEVLRDTLRHILEDNCMYDLLRKNGDAAAA